MAFAPAVVLVETEIQDIFKESGSQRLAQSLSNTAQNFVRRPLRGIQIKRETFASLSVSGPGLPPRIVNSSVPAGYEAHFTSNFILQAISETRVEKFQAVTTFGAAYGYFFGEQPRTITCQAILLNTADFQWEVEWWQNYEHFFRGTQLVNRGMRAYLSYDDAIIEGYLTQAATNKSASDPYQASLSFVMWVTNVIHLISPGTQIDPRHSPDATYSASLEFDAVESAGNPVDITDDVRAANVKALTSAGTGLLAALRNAEEGALVGYTGATGATLGNVREFLYGRNLAVPVGFAGSDASSPSAFGNLRVPASTTGWVRIGQKAQDFYENIDEYPARAINSRLTPSQADSVLQETFGIGLSGTSREEQNQMYTELAEATSTKFGYDITNEEGLYASDTLRTLGKAAFAAVSYAGLTTGISQSASSLTVVGGTTGNTIAAAQQAVLEELNL